MSPSTSEGTLVACQITWKEPRNLLRLMHLTDMLPEARDLTVRLRHAVPDEALLEHVGLLDRVVLPLDHLSSETTGYEPFNQRGHPRNLSDLIRTSIPEEYDLMTSWHRFCLS